MTTVAFYFDFLSPYAFLALCRAPAFAREHGVRFELRPVVYGALLDATGLVGPAETPAKRAYTFADVARCAHLEGVPLVGPPAHPFRSLDALRTAVLFRGDERGLELCAALARAAWSEGRDLTDWSVLEDVVRAAGLDAQGLRERASTPEVKARLRELTDEALSQGVFGVPSFLAGDELFWGHDRMEHLARHLAGQLPPVTAATRAVLARPRGVDRRRVREASADGASVAE